MARNVAEDVFEIECILDEKRTNGEVQSYFVKHKGSNEESWESADDLFDCGKLIEAYEASSRPPTMEQIMLKSRDKLKNQLQRLGLPLGGTKKELAMRIIMHGSDQLVASRVDDASATPRSRKRGELDETLVEQCSKQDIGELLDLGKKQGEFIITFEHTAQKKRRRISGAMLSQVAPDRYISFLESRIVLGVEFGALG